MEAVDELAGNRVVNRRNTNVGDEDLTLSTLHATLHTTVHAAVHSAVHAHWGTSAIWTLLESSTSAEAAAKSAALCLWGT